MLPGYNKASLCRTIKLHGEAVFRLVHGWKRLFALHRQNFGPLFFGHRDAKLHVFPAAAVLAHAGAADLATRLDGLTGSYIGGDGVNDGIGQIGGLELCGIMIWVSPTSSPKVPIFATELALVRMVAIISSRMDRPLPFQ